jgi:hypothetical protein
VQRVELRQTDYILAQAKVGVNFMHAAKSGDENTPVRINHTRRQLQINRFLRAAHVLDQAQ